MITKSKFSLLICSLLLMLTIAILFYYDNNSNPTVISNIKFSNTVVITDGYSYVTKKNEATEYAKELLINALLTTKHDSIKQYKPIHFYTDGIDITDTLEYHSLIDVKTLAIAIRVMLVNNNDTELHITNMIVKSKEYKDLFILPIDLTLQPYQKTYIIWYITIAGENVTELGISQLLQSLAYTDTQYKHPLIKDILLLDGYGQPLFNFITLSYKNVINDNLELNAILKNNSAKEWKVKTITVRNSNNGYIFAYDLAEELTVPAYANVTVKVRIT